ncbi:MAG: ABC transporter transmembrane domain-containing protein, partial [Bacillota bacterium]
MGNKNNFKEHKEIIANGNKPLLLDDPNKIWLVKRGKIRVFAVKVKEGEIYGNRRYLATFKKDELLFGVDFSSSDHNLALIAIGEDDTRLAESNRAEFDNQRAEDLNLAAQNLTQWIESILKGVLEREIPRDYQELEVKDDFELAQGKVAVSGDYLLWAKVKEGSVSFKDYEELGLVASSAYFPVYSHSWVKALEDTSLAVITTESLVGQDDFWELLHLYQQLMLDIINLKLALLKREEEQRLEQRVKKNNSFMEEALAKIGNVIDLKDEQIIKGAIGRSKLYQACKLVGANMDIEIKEPQQRKNKRAGTDPLKEIIRASKIKKRKILLENEWWLTDSGPLLAYWEENEEPLALIPTEPGKYEAYDLENDKVIPVNAEVADKIKPFGYSFYRPFPNQKLNLLDLLKFGLESNWRRDFVFIVLLGIGAGLLGLVVPQATGMIFDRIVPQAARNQLLYMGLILFATTFAKFTFEVARSITMMRVENRMSHSIQAAVWDRVLKLPMPFFRDYNTGDLAQRTSSINAIRQSLSGATLSTLLSSVFSLFNLGLLFYYSPKLALVAIVLVVISLVVTLLASYLSIRYQREIAAADGKIRGLVLQLIGAIAKLRVANAEKRAFYLWSESFSEKKKLRFKAENISNYLTVFNSVYPIITSMIIFWSMFQFMQGGEGFSLATGMFLAFNAAFTSFMSGVLSVSNVFITILS